MKVHTLVDTNTYKKGAAIIQKIRARLGDIFSEQSKRNDKSYINPELSEYKIRDYLENVMGIE